MSNDKGSTGDTPDARRYLVWDWPTRVFHWAVALGVLGSWITAEGFDWLDWHMIIGYVLLGLVAFRLIWGFVGPKHARFAGFVRGPGAVLAYLRTLPKRRASDEYVGHNPLGAVAVMVMLVLLAVQAVTGLFASDELLHLGPYNGAVPPEVAETLTSIHKTNSDILLILIWIHIGSVFLYLLWKRQNLITPMITGRKALEKRDTVAGGEEAIRSSRSGLALVLALLVALAVWLLVTLAPPPPPPEFF